MSRRGGISAILEHPREWEQTVAVARQATEAARSDLVDGGTEMLLWQTLIGTWGLPGTVAGTAPVSESRLAGYLTKAMRENKLRTSWTAPDEAYEEAVFELARSALRSPEVRVAMDEFVETTFDTVRTIILGQKLVQLTMPGVPDVYQGCEIVDLSLVDPDNRRAVDFAKHQATLDEIGQLIEAQSLDAVAAMLRDSWQDGRLKLLVTSRLLALRHSHAAAFAGDYLALATQGTFSDHLCAYARIVDAGVVITVVSRWAATMTGGAMRAPLGEEAWQDTAVLVPPKIAPGRYVDVLTGRVHQVAAEADGTLLAAGELFATLPCCVLAPMQDAR